MYSSTTTAYNFLVYISIIGLPAVAGVLSVDSDPAIADVHVVAGTHAVAGVSAVVGNTVTGSHALVLVHAVPGAHALAGVSVVKIPLLLLTPCIMMFQRYMSMLFKSHDGKVFRSLETFPAWCKLAEKRGRSGQARGKHTRAGSTNIVL